MPFAPAFAFFSALSVAVVSRVVLCVVGPSSSNFFIVGHGLPARRDQVRGDARVLSGTEEQRKRDDGAAALRLLPLAVRSLLVECERVSMCAGLCQGCRQRPGARGV